ncbi:ku80-like protein [Punctularia strigosozonata HHB-11173 SS5]|uniref:ku80-like protein n=1 Tax=Punctularia strigosozonata (strain HHB-11173) TaxID=741275 RepID=UPI00044177E2|nr:ku80-like protein [Punctularia strigosozonata HHB-11173 SS5]EIN13322.1 ku80-like protein [Punctularia strigosozonata HHB-11173 SS5]
MPAERAGYTVTMFLVDISPSMGKLREVELPPGPKGERRTTEVTNLEWGLQFVKLKIQEMIFHGRKTEQCGVILFGTEETHNLVHDQMKSGYEHVSEYIPISQPNAGTLAKLSKLQPSEVSGDPIDALIVGLEAQAQYLGKKKTWTRKIVLLTDGESPMEIEDWEATVRKMNDIGVSLTIVGIDFDDDDLPFHEEGKSRTKAANEQFYRSFVAELEHGIVGTCALALREITRPDIKETKSALTSTMLRLGDVDARPEEALELVVRTSKCTALARPKGWKRFAPVRKRRDGMDVDEDGDRDGGEEVGEKVAWTQLAARTEYYVGNQKDEDGEDGGDHTDDESAKDGENGDGAKVEKEDLVRGFKYGATYVPCPEGAFPRLETRKGIDICGFFKAKNFRRELAMGEVYYVWADPAVPAQQIALSSIAQAMEEKGVMAIARWVSRDGMDPKMGVLAPSVFEKIDCLLWVQMPFADDVRKYTFASLDTLINKNGEVVEEHAYLPTPEQQDAMDAFVDAMDLMEAGEKDEEGNRYPWYDTRLSYNPAIHRTKQALFHSAVAQDLNSNPLPPPHPELLKYFEPPKKVLKRAAPAIEHAKAAFKVREVPKRVAKGRQDGHRRARDEDEDVLLLDKFAGPNGRTQSQSQVQQTQELAETERERSQRRPKRKAADSETESESEEEALLLDAAKPQTESKVGKPVSKRNAAHGRPPPTPPAEDGARMDVDPGAESQADVDPGLEPGRIVGMTYPLEDFKKNIARGDVVTKAVEDLAAVIMEIVMRPFSGRRRMEMVDCMRAMRDTCLKEDEIDAWNQFLRNLKDQCISQSPGNREFWSSVAEEGRELSLISDKEAKQHGGRSSVSEKEATNFMKA